MTGAAEFLAGNFVEGFRHRHYQFSIRRLSSVCSGGNIYALKKKENGNGCMERN